MSLNARLKVLEEAAKTTGITEDQAKQIVADQVKPIQDKITELVEFTGVDEDKPQPTPPAQAQ